jgi:hypothetical protein
VGCGVSVWLPFFFMSDGCLVATLFFLGGGFWRWVRIHHVQFGFVAWKWRAEKPESDMAF